MLYLNLLTLLCCLHSIQSLELPVNISIAIEVLERVAGHVPRNDTKVQEFANILDYFVKCTLTERRARKEVDREKNSNSTGDEGLDLNITLPWQEALNEALDEENITAGFDKTIREIVEHLDTFISNAKNVTPGYLQLLSASRKSNDESYENLAGSEHDPVADAGNSSFWDVTLTRRIYNGKRAKIKRFPFMASVMIFNEFACAGTIIKSDLIITAASCLQLAHNNRFFRENPAFLSVRVGSTFMKVGGNVVPVVEVYFHPYYEPRTLHNNLAIMRLLRLLSFKHRSVKKIDFDRNAFSMPANAPGITIIGWGAKTITNKLLFNARLHAMDLDLYDPISCREVYGDSFITRTNFCAGFITRGEGACNHDVGDPGVSGRYLMGVTSFGSPICGQVDTPTVFTKLGYYTDWIEDIMEQEVPRIRLSTTTRRPFYLDKDITLYGIHDGEDKPIPVVKKRLYNKTNIMQPIQTKIARQKNYVITLDQDPELVEQPGIEYNEKNVLSYQEANNNVGRSKMVDADPEIELTEIQGEHPYNEVESDNLQMDSHQSGEDNEKEVGRIGPDMNENGNSEIDNNDKERYTTAMVDFEPVQQYSDIENLPDPAQQDSDIDSVGRPSEPELNDSADSAPELDNSDSSRRPVTTGTDDVDAAEDLSDIVEDVIPHMGINADEDIAKTNENENNSGDIEKTDKSENYNTTDIESTTKNEVLIKNKQSEPPADKPIKNVSLLKNKVNRTEEAKSKKLRNIGKNVKLTEIRQLQKKPIQRQELRNQKSKSPVNSPMENIYISKDLGSKTNNSITNYYPHIDEINDSVELVYGRKHTAKRPSIQIPVKDEESKSQLLPQTEIADDAVKREIQKLITQLQNSNELGQDDKPTNRTPSRNLLDNIDTDERKPADTVFTFLYLSDSEKKPQLRASDEGLDIDSESFQKQMRRVSENNFINKSEIYGIFADVMNTVANKTMK